MSISSPEKSFGCSNLCYPAIGWCLLLIVLIINILRAPPFYNWDILGYVAASYMSAEHTPEQLHSKTFSEVQKHVPQAKYLLIVNGPPDPEYRASIARNPRYFAQQVPFYSVKPAYPFFIFLSRFFGMNSVASSIMISRLAYFGIGVVIFLWLSNIFRPVGAAAITSVVVSIPTFMNLARSSTPDALSVLIILISLLVFSERNAIRGGLILLALAITVRPDNLLLLLLMAGCVAILHREFMRAAVGVVFVGTIIYFVQGKLSGNYGYAVLYYHTFVELLSEPASFISPLVLSDYLYLHYNYILEVVQSERPPPRLFIGFTVLNLLGIVARYRQTGIRDIYLQVSFINLLNMIAHWVLFPGDINRMLAGPYVVVVIVLLKVLACTLRGKGFERYLSGT